jgi:hypothetical protein
MDFSAACANSADFSYSSRSSWSSYSWRATPTAFSHASPCSHRYTSCSLLRVAAAHAEKQCMLQRSSRWCRIKVLPPDSSQQSGMLADLCTDGELVQRLELIQCLLQATPTHDNAHSDGYCP